ncbi:hypothetical protein RvY_14063-3 [Ramazzottius varieornatus]|uniref:DNA-directed RNA polymerase n=1 Tax=Ramazzottius varieornatus TaxID=947166 RepID=A0A1D1VRR6_RAMVA|nr:hypothetical protein RvY_14063-3 [Ramazzottius varieornatus]
MMLLSAVLYRVPETGSFGGDFVVDKVSSRQLYPVLDALNQLAASPWMVNQAMLDLIIEVFGNKGMADVDIPQPISQCPPLPKIRRDMTAEERSEAYRQRFLLKKKRNEMFSLWCDALYKLSIANHFRDRVFWLPQNIDFRGRVYPVPPHFQHLGGDMARSMLLLAKGMALGDKGLNWLKIHLINLTGLKKKQSLEERLQYANEMMKDILDSADNPLHGGQWWKKSDDPWQTLACCKEIAKASRHAAGAAAFVSHFPIHQDGSCNGLQHYAALGRDQKGAEAVNLYPFQTPQDVYSGVAALVEESRKTDADHKLEIAQVLDGFVSRKVVKQTVMTIVYGVTRYGAKAQIQGQLADLKDFPHNKTWPAAAYLAAKTFDSIGQMFTATRRIQDWFVDCARLISTVREKPVEWLTPLGLPVLQPYFKQSSTDQARSKMHLTLHPGKVNTMKQKNAFPPNFIHSLDSSHMMLTCLHCAREGISFAAVHDSYWTHPATVDIMNKHCRQQFVALHRLPILEDLSAYLTQRFAYDKSEYVPVSADDPRAELNRVLGNVPPKGTFDLESVLMSTFFFS